MTTEQIIKAWKDAKYFDSLNEGELDMLPQSPVGGIEMTESELGNDEKPCITSPHWLCSIGPKCPNPMA